MSVWDSYFSRVDTRDASRRDAVLAQEQARLRRKLPSHLSYQNADVGGKQQELAIISSDNFNLKTVCSMPGEKLLCGDTVFWADNHWLITETDANDEVYARGQMKQCNYLLRWIAADGHIVERWCVVEDGTKYLTGERAGSSDEVSMSIGDTRVAVTLPRDEYTVKLDRTFRFLIDDPDSDNVLAYKIGKPFKVGSVYNGRGVVSYVLTEVNLEEDDNTELRIANYYKYFPRSGEAVPDAHEMDRPTETPEEHNGRKVWL